MANNESGKQAEEFENKDNKKVVEDDVTQAAEEALVEDGAASEQDVADDQSGSNEMDGSTEGNMASESSEVELLLAQLADREEELAGQKEAVLRAHAEVQNMRRRCEQDVEKAHKYALEKFSAELLNVADNLERALQAVAESEDGGVKALAEGVDLTLKGLLETFNKFAIEQLDPVGEPFDPQVHEAMSMVPNPEMEPNAVMAVIQKGYTLNGRVLRPARVIVVKGE